MDNKLYIVMVGLPARGKSTTANKIKEDLRHDSVRVKIFNNGDLRRKMVNNNTSIAEFFNPKNREGFEIRERIAEINLESARNYLKTGGDVAILDATNASKQRRDKIRSILNDHPILFIECVNDDEEILNASVLRKIETPEFSHLSVEEAIRNFNKRISYYTPIYRPLKDEPNFIRINSLHKTVIREEVKNGVPYYDQIRDFLVTDSIHHLYLIRHGETFFNIENRIGGDSDLTEKGLSQARDLAEYFSNREIPLIFTSQKKRTIQTAEPISARQKKCTIIPLAEFNEIDSGICESMSYSEIREKYPPIYAARKKDKYHYSYPEGEGYASMKERIDHGINKVLYLSDSSSNIMIIGHRAVNRMILSHFLFRREEDVPYIYIPQDKFYYISVTQNRKFFQLKKYK
ncbi:MAG: histidine phosphatase family protein [Deltaproteobacteria bacterium]|nr:histidine phosphatase family protein [Deltaproteobacteria bacterium]